MFVLRAKKFTPLQHRIKRSVIRTKIQQVMELGRIAGQKCKYATMICKGDKIRFLNDCGGGTVIAVTGSYAIIKQGPFILIKGPRLQDLYSFITSRVCSQPPLSRFV